MFKLYNTRPTASDSIEVICDYMEYRCILSKKKKFSIDDLVREFVKPADEYATSGIEDVEDKIREKISVVGSEIERRYQSTNKRYPFKLIDKGNVMQFSSGEGIHKYLYLYLLFATRLDMNTDKIFKKIDGALLFESISANVAETYFGKKSKSHVFGTSASGGFKGKVDQLISLVKEGVAFLNQGGGELTENDGKLDFVTWIDFSDSRESKFIGFGQSKTGTTWEKHLSDLQPAEFCSSWFQRRPVLVPIRMFFIADIPESQHWYKKALLAGLFFDRLRILDYAPLDFEVSVGKKIKDWTKAAIESAKPNLHKILPSKRKSRKSTKMTDKKRSTKKAIKPKSKAKK